MKKINLLLSIMIALVLILQPFGSINALASDEDTSDEEITCVEVLEIEPQSDVSTCSTTKSRTASKTKYYKADGKNVWYVKVTATFTYDGTRCSCTSASVSGGSYYSNWKVSNMKVSRAANKATATATGTKYFLSVVTNTINATVSINCSGTGTIS